MGRLAGNQEFWNFSQFRFGKRCAIVIMSAYPFWRPTISDHQFELQTEELQGALVISVAGRIDGVNAQEFQENLDQKAESSSDSQAIVLDLENLSYISSAGLRSILLIAKTLKSKQMKFAMCSLSEPIMEIIQITGFDKIIDIHESRSVAVTAMAG